MGQISIQVEADEDSGTFAVAVEEGDCSQFISTLEVGYTIVG